MNTEQTTEEHKTSIQQHILKVKGLNCPEEAELVRAAVRSLAGVKDINFDYTSGTVCIACAVGGATADQLAATITAAGLPASLVIGNAPVVIDEPNAILLWVVAGAIVVTLIGFSIAVMDAGNVVAALSVEASSYQVKGCYLLALALCWVYLLPRTWSSISALRADMYVLMAIAVGGALVLDDWLEAVTVSILFLISLTLENWSVSRARRAIAALFALAPTQARVRDDQGEQLVPAESVQTGAVVVVQPGERVPLDGIVLSGASHLDQSPITGESLPVLKNQGDTLYAGTVNAEGLLTMRTNGTVTDTTLARMTRLVAEARNQRGRTERWVDRFAALYTPAVVVVALAMAIMPPLLFDGSWGVWFYRALVLLVIACPCALVIATPVAMVAALASAARVGVLVKGGEHLEKMARLRSMALDKTGTLTTGKPSVMAIIPAHNQTEIDVLGVAASLEARSDHPLARAIVTEAHKRGVSVYPTDEMHNVPGKGIIGSVGGKSVWLGSPRFAQEQVPGGWIPDDISRGSSVLVGRDGIVLGCILVADTVRPEAGEALMACRRLGVEHIVMLTGDNVQIARIVGDQLGIEIIHAGLLPADKVERVAELANRKPAVAFIGDGVNDAPALARADLGIAMGAAATPAAMETADVALLGDDLRRLPWLIVHARRMRGIVIQNISVSLGGKAVFLLLTLTGHSSLWLAIAADTGISLLVTINALRLLSSSHSLKV